MKTTIFKWGTNFPQVQLSDFNPGILLKLAKGRAFDESFVNVEL